MTRKNIGIVGFFCLYVLSNLPINANTVISEAGNLGRKENLSETRLILKKITKSNDLKTREVKLTEHDLEGRWFLRYPENSNKPTRFVIISNVDADPLFGSFDFQLTNLDRNVVYADSVGFIQDKNIYLTLPFLDGASTIVLNVKKKGKKLATLATGFEDGAFNKVCDDNAIVAGESTTCTLLALDDWINTFDIARLEWDFDQ